MATTVDLGKVTGAQGPQGPQGPTGPQGDSYITKYVVDSSNTSVELPQGVYAVNTNVTGGEQVAAKLSGRITSLFMQEVTSITYGYALLDDVLPWRCDLFILES